MRAPPPSHRVLDTTGNEGQLSARGLPAGTYDLTVTLAAFTTQTLPACAWA